MTAILIGPCCCYECPEISFIRAYFDKARNSQGALSSELVLVTRLYGSISLRLELRDPRDLLNGFTEMKVYRRSDSAEIGTLSWATDNTETGGASQITNQHAGIITLTLNQSTDTMPIPGTCVYVAADVELIISGSTDPKYYGYTFTIGGYTQ